MLQDLLDLAGVDSGNLHFRLNPVILNTLVAEVALMSQKVSNRKITLVTTKDQVVTCALCDRLQQVWINGVDNAKPGEGSIFTIALPIWKPQL